MIPPKNALLIDDDEDCRFLTKRVLQKLQIFEKIDALTSGKEALDFIIDNCINKQSDNCPNVIFLDNFMPGMNGFGFLDKLMNTAGVVKENFQIYMVSSFTNDMDKERLKKYNILGFINKPLSLNKLKSLFN